MVKKDKDKKGKSEFDAHFIRLESLTDLARFVCDFTPALQPIYSFKENGKYRFFAEGEKIDDTHLMYYAEGASTARYGIYTPVNQYSRESFQLLDRYEKEDYKVYKFNVVEFENKPYKEKQAKADTITYMRIKEPVPLITAMMSRGMQEESMSKVYAFKFKSESFVGTFDLMGANDTKVFLFSKVEMKEPCGFFRYSYQADKLEPTNDQFENQYLYVRIINLAEPPPGFKPEGTKL